MFRIVALVLAALATAASGRAQPPEKKELPKPLPDDVVKAWTDAGATVGWVRVDASGMMILKEHSHAGAIPTFEFNPLKTGVRAGVVAKLPAPNTPFGLILAHTEVTDAELKELARFTNLTALSLRCSGWTAAGLKELAPLRSLTTLDLYNKDATDQILQVLREIGLLHALSRAHTDGGQRPTRSDDVTGFTLYDSAVTDAGLKDLAILKNLTSLDLSVTKVTDAGLKELVALKKLTELRLFETNVTSAGLKDLGTLTGLTALDLSYTGVTDAGLKELTGLKNLVSLDLVFTPVTDVGLKELTALKKLTSLNLENATVTSAGLKELAAIKTLNFIELSDRQITDQVLQALRETGRLHVLDRARTADTGRRPAKPEDVTRFLLWNTAVTDAGLKELVHLKNLAWLDAGSTKVTDAGLKELVHLKGLTELFLYGTAVTDAGLQELAQFKNLTVLDLSDTKVTKDGVAELRKALPKCDIIGP